VVCTSGVGSGAMARVTIQCNGQIPGNKRRWCAAEEDLGENPLIGGSLTERARPIGGTVRALGLLGSGLRES
jgi:hypothetical protein